MEAAMNFLRGIKPWWLKDYVFIVLLLLYVLGPLEYFVSFIPTIWSLPAIFIISGPVWRFLEAKLSKARVKPDGKAIFVSGCDSGFGFELAKRMAGKGFHVYAGCLFPDGDGAKTLSETPNVFIVNFDVTKEDIISDAIVEIKQRLAKDKKTLWGVVANAGIALIGPFEWTSMEEIKNVFDVNVFGVIRTVKAFLPLLKGSRGRFVITGSVSSVTSYQLLIPYSMTKTAVKFLADGLRREVGRHAKVYFTTILPTFHDTPMLRGQSEDQITRKFEALSEEERNAISPKYLERCQTEHRGVLTLFRVKSLSGVLRSFDHALTSTRPRPYYICDRPFMSFIFYPILHHFPIETTDFFFQGFHGLASLLEYFPGVNSRGKNENKTS